MVARALCGCGLDLGDESELLGPTEHNDHGHDVAEAYVALCAEAGPVCTFAPAWLKSSAAGPGGQ